MEDLLPPDCRERFNQAVSNLPDGHIHLMDTLLARFQSQASTWRHTTANKTPGLELQAIFDQATAHFTLEQSQVLARGLCARLALAMPVRIAAENLPDGVLDYYPDEFRRFSDEIEAYRLGEREQGDALIAMHTRFLFCLTVPCGAQDLDLNDRIPLSSPVLAVLRERSLRSLLFYFRCRGTGIWLRPHTNVSRLDEFNEEGWDKFYFRAADVLRRRPHVRGLALTSWFYDPAVATISPRLGFLQNRPLERGAHRMKHRSTESAIEFATRTSETRRKKYQAGEYLPTEYSIVWDRKSLIGWADKHEG